MTYSAQQWLSKATLVDADITGPTYGGLLSPDQVKQFLRVAIEASVLVSDCRQETSNATKFEVPRISFGSRILRSGTEATRLTDANRIKPATGLVTLTTNLYKGEVPVSDEVFEDNIEKEGFADTLMAMIAEAVGRDVEELSLKNDTARVVGDGDSYPDFDIFDGLIKSMQTNTPSAQKISATGETKYATIFKLALESLPARYKRNYSALRFYVPIITQEGYQTELEARGTSALGDSAVADDIRTSLSYHGIKVVGVPLLSGTDTINAVAVDYSTKGFLIDPTNIVYGWHRRVRMERWRDPREAATSFIPSVRFDSQIADPNAVSLIEGIPVL